MMDTINAPRWEVGMFVGGPLALMASGMNGLILFYLSLTVLVTFVARKAIQDTKK